jgi:GT2 family glycosyltransferase
MKLSIVIATLNRLRMLNACLESIYEYTSVEREIIIVDGGSKDGTRDFLMRHHDLFRTIYQGRPLGAVKAYNAGFALAVGDYVVALNDDLALRDRCLDQACRLLDNAPEVGQVAIPFRTPIYPHAKLDYIRLVNQIWLYANFGVTRRLLGESVGWWGDYYHHYGGDSELSMKVWNAGQRVVGLGGCCLYHYESQDDTRQKKNKDSALFYQRWRQWKGPGDDQFLR